MSKKVTTEIVPAAEVAKFKQGNTEIVQIANALTVADPKDENNAYDILKRIKIMLKVVEDRRTSITKPLNASLREVNALFKPLSAPLKEADTTIRGKILDFQDEQEEKAAKQQAIRDKVQATKEAKGIETEELEEVVPDVGETTTIKRWVIRITDPKKLPEKILRQLIATDEGYEVMEKWLRNELRNCPKGEDNKPVLEIPGTEVYQDKCVRV